MDRRLAIRATSIFFAFLIGATSALAQTMSGIETKRVKTIPIHRGGTSSNLTLMPSARSASKVAPPAIDVPVVKVPTIRVRPTGEMTYPPPRDQTTVDGK